MSSRNAKLNRHFAETRIVEAAIGVFADRSPRDTPVEELIQAAGISRRTFYKYFPSKDAVLAAIYRLITDQLVQLLGDGSGQALDVSLVHDAVDGYIDFHITNGQLLRHLMEVA